MKKRRFLLVLLMGLILALLLAACGGGEQPAAEDEPAAEEPAAEEPAAEEPAAGRQGRWMRRLDDHVPGGVDEGLLLAGVAAPQDEHHPVGLGVDCGEHLVGETLPAFALV